MKIETAENQEEWDNWLQNKSEYDPFGQSWEWGDLLIREGVEVERLEIIEEDKKIAQAQVIYTKLPFGWKYVFCPKGPVISQPNLELEIYEALSHYFKEEKCIFFRFEPAHIQLPLSNIRRTIDINPPATLILDLKKSELELMNGMHQKTRYNIHLAEKKDIKIIDKKDFDLFWDLMKKTGARDNFKLHGKAHYRQVFASPLSYQLTTTYENKVVACAVFIGFGNTFTYLYGASDYEFRNLMAPYLLQWKAVQAAKSRGYRYYDFFGVAPKTKDSNDYEYDRKHQYAGVTRFKLGFGGFSYQTAGTYDLIMDKGTYGIYQFLRKLRRLV